MSDAIWTGAVIEELKFMDAHTVNKQLTGFPWFDLMTVFYFRRKLRVMLGEKKQLEVCPSRCQLVRG